MNLAKKPGETPRLVCYLTMFFGWVFLLFFIFCGWWKIADLTAKALSGRWTW